MTYTDDERKPDVASMTGRAIVSEAPAFAAQGAPALHGAWLTDGYL